MPLAWVKGWYRVILEPNAVDHSDTRAYCRYVFGRRTMTRGLTTSLLSHRPRECLENAHTLGYRVYLPGRRCSHFPSVHNCPPDSSNRAAFKKISTGNHYNDPRLSRSTVSTDTLSGRYDWHARWLYIRSWREFDILGPGAKVLPYKKLLVDTSLKNILTCVL